MLNATDQNVTNDLTTVPVAPQKKETVGEEIVREADDDMLQLFYGMFKIVPTIPGGFAFWMVREFFEPWQKFWYLCGLKVNNSFWVRFFTQADLNDKESWAQAVYNDLNELLTDTNAVFFPVPGGK